MTLFLLLTRKPYPEPPRYTRLAQALRDDPQQSVASICQALGITRTTFYRYTSGNGDGG